MCGCVLCYGGEAGQGQGSAELWCDGDWQSTSREKRFTFAVLQDYLNLAPGPAGTASPKERSARALREVVNAPPPRGCAAPWDPLIACVGLGEGPPVVRRRESFVMNFHLSLLPSVEEATSFSKDLIRSRSA